MQLLKTTLKVMATGTLIVAGVVIGGTVLAAKGIDHLGDDLNDKLH